MPLSPIDVNNYKTLSDAGVSISRDAVRFLTSQLGGDRELTRRELEILKRIARGEKEVRAGKGHDLDDVMADADELLSK